MLSSVVLAEGMSCGCHVAPPSFEVEVPATPTATQEVALGQSTALRSGRPLATSLSAQAPPPSVETAAKPSKLLSPPTATQSIGLVQKISLKFPLPEVAPPEIATTGALSSLDGVVQTAAETVKLPVACEPWGEFTIINADADPAKTRKAVLATTAMSKRRLRE